MTDTRQQLVDCAIDLVRNQGYAGFSYADLAESVGIRKPSIHHHFPAKEDLGRAAVETYSAAFFERLAAIKAAPGSRRDKIRAYAGIYREVLKAGQNCLCGMLASEVAILPEGVRQGVFRFFDGNLRWLAEILSDGAKRVPAQARGEASLIMGSLQGALLIARTLGNPQVFDDAVKALLERIESGAG